MNPLKTALHTSTHCVVRDAPYQGISIIGSLNAAWAFHALGTPPAWPMSEALIESRQLIGWWRDAVSDAITSSAYDERTIHSSDFSEECPSLHCDFVVAIFWPKKYIFRMRFIHLHFGDCLQWNFVLLAVKCHGISPLPTAVRAIPSDPHSKCVKCLGFSHARDAVYGVSKCELCENLRLITLRSRLEVCEKESSIFPHRAPEALVSSRPGVRMLSTRRWRVSRQASPFLSLPHRMNSRRIIFFLARGYVIPFPSG